MENIKDTIAGLEHLRNDLDAVDEKGSVQTERILGSLKSYLVEVESREIAENDSKLRRLAGDLVSLEKAQFSFMRIFDIEQNELVHSNFLAWLFDPLGSHGLGSQFGEKFLKKVASKTENLDLSIMDPAKSIVEREVSGDESRLDIRIHDPSDYFQCVIENKILSGEGADQTDRLFRNFHGKSQTEVFVFLTLKKREKPMNSNFVSLTYHEVLPILQSLLQVSPSAETTFLIRNYVSTLERLIMSENFEGFSERTKLYYQYEKYINDVRKAFDQDRKLILQTLEDGIKNRSWWKPNLWDMERTGGLIRLWKNEWYDGNDKGVYIQIEASTRRSLYHLFIFGETPQFSARFGPIFERFLDEKHPGKLLGEFSKKFAQGTIRFVQKDVHLSLTEKSQPPQELLKNLDEMLNLFEDIIDKSIEEFRKK